MAAAGAARRLVFAEAEALRQFLRGNGRRVLGVDVGSFRVGFALAENVDGVALPLKVVKRPDQSTAEASAFIRQVVQSGDVGGLVVGWPVEIDGSEGVSCRRVTRFMRQVSREAKVSLPYTFYDESNTTVDAYEGLKDAVGLEHAQPKFWRSSIDKHAAAEILQGYIDEGQWE